VIAAASRPPSTWQLTTGHRLDRDVVATLDEAEEQLNHVGVGIHEDDSVPALRALCPIQHAALDMQRLAAAGVGAAMLLRGQSRGPSCLPPLSLPAKLRVVDRVRFPQRRMLVRPQLDVSHPAADRALGNA
jgi:hypothetical protein